MSLFLLLISFIIFSTLVFLHIQPKTQERIAFVNGLDEDIKIAQPSGAKATQADEVSEREAIEFMRQKSSGNIELARDLGKHFANLLLEDTHPIFDGGLHEDGKALHLRQQLVLYSYVVNRVISECSPNSILAQTSLNVFYNTLEDTAPLLHSKISDMAAFSLYILWERKASHQNIGSIYAGLCDKADNQSFTQEGDVLYRRFYNYCKSQYDEIDFNVV